MWWPVFALPDNHFLISVYLAKYSKKIFFSFTGLNSFSLLAVVTTFLV